jgi:hypothetical protein
MNKIDYLDHKNEKSADSQSDRINWPVVGRIAASSQPGDLMVEFDGSAPIAARLLSGLNRIELCKPENIGREVLLVFEEGDPKRPIITGQMQSLLEDLVSTEINKEDIKGERPEETLVDGERVVFEAKKEIVLKCGKGSIKIRKDGKIVIKGTDLLSRSSGGNRIKGGSVNIN